MGQSLTEGLVYGMIWGKMERCGGLGGLECGALASRGKFWMTAGD